MKRALLPVALALVAAVAATAEPHSYELYVPAVQCSHSSARAQDLVDEGAPVIRVRADARAHKLSIRLDDSKISIEAVTALLTDNGYPVTETRLVR